MMTDRELLELAAKAAGMSQFSIEETTGWPMVVNIDPRGNRFVHWNPLHDDGDALRLAVKLNMHIGIECESAGTVTLEWDFDQGGCAQHSIEQDAPIDGDDYAATRRAIVRAAAAMADNQGGI